MNDEISFGAAAMARLDVLGAISDDEKHLTRLYLSPAHLRAIDVVAGWMRTAGMRTRIDAVGNVIGRYEGDAPGAPALLMGSHIDTVVDAGRYDGNLGVVAAIAVVAELNRHKRRFGFALEVIAFGDEEGVRFPSALLGSRAVVGAATPEMLEARDKDGVSIAQALGKLSAREPSLAAAAYSSRDCLAYLEAHIEQGPILEAENLALGVVTTINGAARYWLDFAGTAGHSGTVPMDMRHDALAAAAELTLAVEKKGREIEGVVATVGQIQAEPGAVNVIPGHVRLSLDIRGTDDAVRHAATTQIFATARDIATRRGVIFSEKAFHEAPAVASDAGLVRLLLSSLGRLGHPTRLMGSGAGHDAMMMARLCPMVMLFVRCRGGVSHHPDESTTAEDIDAAIRVMLAFVEDFAATRERSA